MKLCLRVIVLVCLTALSAVAQEPKPALSFDVAIDGD